MKQEFWKSAGIHLLKTTEEGTLAVTPDFLRAYLARPELAPVEESCDAELALHDSLMSHPLQAVEPARIAALGDADVQENYQVFLRFRDCLVKAQTLEAAYLSFARADVTDIPPLFVDQIVHAILGNILHGTKGPIRLRAAELFFRHQVVNLDDGRIMLADQETVEMYAATGGYGGLSQLLMQSDTPLKSIQLDVLDEDNKALYWGRSDRFDMVVDFRFTQPALDAFARVIEAWIAHFLDVRCRVQPKQRIDDETWRWHIGLDVDATRILNALYEGRDVPLEELNQILALFQLDILDRDAVTPELRGKPIYLGLAMTPDAKLKLKPQNLLVNLPLLANT